MADRSAGTKLAPTRKVKMESGLSTREASATSGATAEGR